MHSFCLVWSKSATKALVDPLKEFHTFVVTGKEHLGKILALWNLVIQVRGERAGIKGTFPF